MSLKIRSLLALGLLACFPLVVVAVGAGIIGGGIVLAGRSGVLGGKVVVFGLIVLSSLVGGVVSALRARPQPARGPELTREAEPGLWQLVDSLAARMGVEGPRRIVVIPDVNAAVTEVGGHREMLLGIPLLASLTRGELASVLAHELGHYAQGHTRLTATTYRWRLLIGGVLERIDSRVVRAVLTGYFRLYLLLSSSADRAQELQADEWSARIVDPLTAASAMERIGHVAACWEVLAENYLPLTGPAERRASLTTGLRSLLQANPLPPGTVTAEPERSLFDSHPPTAERVARFRAAAAASGVTVHPDPMLASDLLRHGATTLDALEQQILADDDPRAEWDEVAALAGQAKAERMAGLMARSAADQGRPGPLTVGDLLALIRAGRGHDLVLPVLRGGMGAADLREAVDDVLGEVLRAAVHLSLAADGRARYAINWSGPWRWQLWYGEQGWQDVDLDALVADAAADRAAVDDLRRTLESWNARLDLEITPQEAVTTDAPPGAIWGHLLLKTPLHPQLRPPRGSGRLCDVLVFPSGVLLVRPGRVVAFGLNAVRARAKKAAQRCNRLLVTVGPDPMAFAAGQGVAKDGGPVARWIPASQLVGVEHTERALRGDLTTLTLRSGEAVVLEHHDSTVTGDDPLQTLKEISAYR